MSRRRVASAMLLLGVFVSALSGAAPKNMSRNAPVPQLLPGEGMHQTLAYCSICHSTEYIPMNAPAQDRAGWQKTVTKMIEVYGAPIPEGDRALIVNYLSAKYSGRKSTP